MKRFALPLLSLVILIVSSSYAEDTTPKNSESVADSMHEEGSSMLFGLTDDIDQFFGDIRTEEHKGNDWFRMGVETKFRATDGVRIRERLRADLDLKDYGKNIRFFISGDRGDRYDNSQRLEDENSGTDFATDYRGDVAASGISYDFYRSNYTLVSVDAGLKFGGAHPFTQFRGSHWFPLSERLSLEPTQYLQYIEGDGFGERTRVDFNYALSHQARFRARTEALRSESSRGVDLLEDLSWLKKFTDRTYAGLALTFTAYTAPTWTPDVYKVSYRYRQLIHDDWLYLEVEPGIEFPNERDYTRTPYVTVRLDAYFERNDL